MIPVLEPALTVKRSTKILASGMIYFSKKHKKYNYNIY